jgi:hypothetical protein
MRANHAHRFVALILDGRGRPVAVAKVALEEPGRLAIAREAAALAGLAGRLTPPLAAPQLVAHETGLLITSAVTWRPRRAPWKLPLPVASALGAFFRTSQAGYEPGGPTHGDCAPWNLLETAGGWTLVDWEAAQPNGRPFHDVFHYLVQAHSLLGRPTGAAIVQGSSGDGAIGRLVAAYAEAADLDPSSAPDQLRFYLRTSMDGTSHRERAARLRLLTAVGGVTNSEP